MTQAIGMGTASDLALDGATARTIGPFSLTRFTGKVASPEVMI